MGPLVMVVDGVGHEGQMGIGGREPDGGRGISRVESYYFPYFFGYLLLFSYFRAKIPTFWTSSITFHPALGIRSTRGEGGDCRGQEDQMAVAGWWCRHKEGGRGTARSQIRGQAQLGTRWGQQGPDWGWGTVGWGSRQGMRFRGGGGVVGYQIQLGFQTWDDGVPDKGWWGGGGSGRGGETTLTSHQSEFFTPWSFGLFLSLTNLTNYLNFRNILLFFFCFVRLISWLEELVK